jgi:hypothetical protein
MVTLQKFAEGNVVNTPRGEGIVDRIDHYGDEFSTHPGTILVQLLDDDGVYFVDYRPEQISFVRENYWA